MTSRLLGRLDAAIAAAGSARDAECLRCERAAYLARLGELDAAARELAEVQARQATRPDAAVSAWWHYAEALVAHFGELSRRSHDRMKRAHALASAAGLRPLQALTHAWLAQFHYHAILPEPMAVHAAAAIAIAAADHHSARARASLVVAEAYHDGGQFDRARPWYERAHRHATEEGDDTGVSAVMSIMTVLRVTGLQHDLGRGRPFGAEGAFASISAGSSSRFDVAFGITGLSELAPMLEAQVLALNDRPAEALEIYERSIEPSVARGYTMTEGSHRADIAWCHLRTGHLDAARVEAERADRCLDRPGSPSDIGAGRDRLRDVYAGLGDAVEAARQDALAKRAWTEYEDLQRRLVAAMDDALAAKGVPPP